MIKKKKKKRSYRCKVYILCKGRLELIVYLAVIESEKKSRAYNREKEAKGWYTTRITVAAVSVERDIDVESINVYLAPVRMADN